MNVNNILPRTINDITPSWLSNVLKTQIISFDIKILSNHGTSGKSTLLLIHNIIYAENDEPDFKSKFEPSYVIKMYKEVEYRKQILQKMNVHVYAKEFYFYKYLQHQILNINTPKIFGMWDDDGDFCILMEDLALRWKEFDRCFSSEHVSRIVQEISKLHQYSSGVDLSSLMFNYDLSTTKTYCSYIERMNTNLPKFIELYSHLNLNCLAGYTKWINFWQTIIADNKQLELSDKIQQVLSSYTQSLIHCDLHHDNIWWRENKNGEYEYVFFDFETIEKGSMGCDMVPFLCSCLCINSDVQNEYGIQSVQKGNGYIDLNILSEQEREDILLNFIIYSASLTKGAVKHPDNPSIVRKLLVVFDIFEQFDMIALVGSILDKS